MIGKDLRRWELIAQLPHAIHTDACIRQINLDKVFEIGYFIKEPIRGQDPF